MRLGLVVVVSAAAIVSAADEPPVTVKLGTSELYLYPTVEYESLAVTIAGRDAVVSHELAAKAEPVVKLVDDRGKALADGHYVYEIVVVPKLSEELRGALLKARDAGDAEAVRELRREAGLGDERLEVSGGFTLVEGRPVAQEAEAGGRVDGEPGSLLIAGDLEVQGAKKFVAPHPEDPELAIHYVSLEGPEAGTYFRGTASTREGVAVVELPDHFARVTAPGGVTVQLTPIGAWSRLYVVEKTARRLVVRSADRAEVEFDFLVQGVRRGHGDHRVVRPAER